MASREGFGFLSVLFCASSRKVGEANKGLGEAPKSCTRKEHESATNPIAKRGQGGTSSLFVCPLQGQGGTSFLFVCPLWGLGHRPNCSASDQSQGSRQQRRRQRSVPAPNFARPQTRPQATLSPRFREEPNKKHRPARHTTPSRTVLHLSRHYRLFTRSYRSRRKCFSTFSASTMGMLKTLPCRTPMT